MSSTVLQATRAVHFKGVTSLEVLLYMDMNTPSLIHFIFSHKPAAEWTREHLLNGLEWKVPYATFRCGTFFLMFYFYQAVVFQTLCHGGGWYRPCQQSCCCSLFCSILFTGTFLSFQLLELQFSKVNLSPGIDILFCFLTRLSLHEREEKYFNKNKTKKQQLTFKMLHRWNIPQNFFL